MTPTQLSLRKLRDDGYTAEVVEHYSTFTGHRHDLFNIIDVIALRGPETLAIQCTTASNALARVHKIADSPHIAAIREAGWTVKCWGWSQKKKGARYELTKDIDCS